MFQKYIFLLFFFLSLHINAQKIVYIDDNNLITDFKTFNKKCTKNPLISCFEILQNKDTTFKVAYKKFNFGKLNPLELKKMKAILNNGDPLTSNYLLSKVDSLAIIKNILQEHKYNLVSKVINETENIFVEIKKDKYKDSSFSISESFIKRFDILYAKKLRNIKKHKGKNVKTIFTNNKAVFSICPHYKVYADTTNFIFKKFIISNLTTRSVIIKPNGEYFEYRRLPKKHIKKLITTTDWTKFKADLKKSYIKKRLIGFFRKQNF